MQWHGIVMDESEMATFPRLQVRGVSLNWLGNYSNDDFSHRSTLASCKKGFLAERRSINARACIRYH